MAKIFNLTPHISNGNMKVGMVPSFSIHTIVCDLIKGPELQGCKRHCYAKNLERRLKNTRLRWAQNFQDSMQENFIETICVELRLHPIVQALKVFRLHVGGDFYDQQYLNDWFAIAEKNPDIVFYTYTKSIDLDFSKKPRNFVINISDDRLLWKDRWEQFDGVTRIADKTYIPLEGEILCANQCNDCVKCDRCKMCWNSVLVKQKKQIRFRKH